MIKNILIPVDFSENAKNAFDFAKQLAAHIGNVNLKVVHVFMPNAETEYPNFVPPIADYLKIREQMLKDFMLEVDPAGEIEHEILIGFASDEMVTQSQHYDLIVMGTTGKGGLINKVFGSVSCIVAQRAHCPVLLVPKGYEYKDFQQIMYASNYESADKSMLNKLIDFNKLFGATVHFVHVRDAESNFARTKEEIFEDMFTNDKPNVNFFLAETDAETVTEGLNDYAFTHNIDLVTMAHRKRNFWEGFFHKSQTKQLAMATELPLLVFHT